MNSILVKSLILVAFCFINFSCNRDKMIKSGSHIVIDLDSVLSDTPVLYSELFSNYELIPLENKEECAFSSIDKVKILNDTIFIMDMTTRSVYIFSPEGKFLGKVCRPGRGPEEYLGAVDFDIDSFERLIFILDWSGRKINVYDFNGNFCRKIVLENRYSGFAARDGNFFLYMPFPKLKDEDDYRLIHFCDSRGSIKWEKLNSDSFLRGPDIIHHIQGGNFFGAADDIKFYMPFCNSIYSLTGNSVKQFIELKTKQFKLTIRDLEPFNLDNYSYYKLAEAGKLTCIENYSESGNIAFFSVSIGLKQAKIFYFFDTERIICTRRLVDDLTSLYPSFLQLNNYKMVACLSPSVKIGKLKDSISSGKLNLPGAVRETILRYDENSNPILVVFELKKH